MTDKILDQEIKAAIDKSLPGQVGHRLNEILTDYEEKKKEIEKLNIQNENKQKTIDQYQKKIKEYEDLYLYEGNIKKRETEVKKRENDLQIELLRKDVDCADQKIQLMQENFNTVFRNVDIVRNKLGRMPLQIRDRNQDGSTFTSVTTEESQINETKTKK